MLLVDFMLETSWKRVESQGDANWLMELVGGLHDGCLREVHIWSGNSVDSYFMMRCADYRETRARLLIQRPWKDPSAIELLFEQVVTFHLQPSSENGDSIIFSATLLRRDDTFYWADLGAWSPESETRDAATWIAAKQLCWRDVSAWMGSELRYGPGSDETPNQSMKPKAPERMNVIDIATTPGVGLSLSR